MPSFVLEAAMEAKRHSRNDIKRLRHMVRFSEFHMGLFKGTGFPFNNAD